MFAQFVKSFHRGLQLFLNDNMAKVQYYPATNMTTLAGGFLVTNYHDTGHKDFKK